MDHPFLPPFEPGSVWLAGAGPGDPGLVTLLALHGLTHADVVVHDALVDDRIIALARPDAAIESMGKRGGQASPKQAEITARLVELARQGKRVLRLKGGDPFVFGRGPEEALDLAEAGIPFRIVPGITAGVGGLAYAGIPATARDCNSTLAFVTGHGAEGDLPAEVDWDAMARGPQVLVFYMAARQVGKVVERLMAGGRPADTPVAVVSRAATPRQQVLESTLGGLEQAVAARPMEAPALVVVGEVVRLRRRLDWWSPA